MSGARLRAAAATAFVAASIAGVTAGSFMGPSPAHGQTCPPPCLPPGSPATTTVVAVDTSDVLPPYNPGDYGVLRRSAVESPAPLIATYMGVSAVGATLALLTSKRRLSGRRERERQTGIAHGRRRRDEFWTEPLPAPAASLRS